ncbi:hypothetical protein [Pedobacter rhizosphaerae]|uniref:Uncharacterized protein n=1 Tax=Pedobacter rhizosphaerae TaxID=390241 RepID=A0A1H9LIK1_9SPHI|nr:hypothetical protein [Pedobacter rhizosphaerae]SER11246.1 hypothetical protein SAMN04488023_104163 [Pedobacter rhizosphaerae]
MKNKRYLSLVFLLTIFGCNDFPFKSCTKEFRYIGITFTNKAGQPRAVKNFKVVNKRTDEEIFSSSHGASRGEYVVIDDSSVEKVRSSGDELIVSVLDSVNNATKSVSVKVKGGRGACHIERISGPEQVQLE